MGYSIKDVATLTGLSEATLRYYDKEGLFPDMQRKKSGYRIFTDHELEQIKYIECFKTSGFEIADIKEYFNLIKEGDNTLNVRLELMKKRKTILEEKMKDLQKSINLINRKIEYYTKAVENGTEKGIDFKCEL